MSGKQTLELAYLAGLFDGEGSFGITKSTLKKITRKDGLPTIRHIANVQIQMIDREPIEAFAAFFGGTVYRWSSGKNGGGKKITVYKFIVNSAGTRKIINALIPHLRCPHKLRGAKLCLELLDLVKRTNRRGKGYIDVPTMQKRDAVYAASLANNSKRGEAMAACK